MIRIVIAEDQSLLRGALATLLSLETDIAVVGEAADGADAWALVRRQTPDVVVADIEMPGLSGIELAERIQAEKLGARVLIVTTFARPGYLQRAQAAGVTGYVLKDTPSDALAASVRKVAAGGLAIDPELAAAAWTAPDPLNDRERQVLRAAESGQTNREIGASLNLAPGTVRNYLANAADKLGAGNRIEAFRIAREQGWL
ncbi:MAG: response regulator transcription factor [Maricaulaceae bacterium]